ncbi:MAG: PAS domain S-box protein [Candidatus Omnitrophica bacterium]|nr:PAS domain S-box protein [Candidatus Omnitrophota bacterium]
MKKQKIEPKKVFRGKTSPVAAVVSPEENSSFFRNVVNSIADPVFVKDRAHRWVFLNRAYCRFMGFDLKELLGRTDYDYFPAEEAGVFYEQDEAVFESGRSNINEEEFTDRQGITHTIVTKKTLYIDEQGRKFIVGVIRNISDHARARNERLRRNKAESALSSVSQSRAEAELYGAHLERTVQTLRREVNELRRRPGSARKKPVS